jgi:hypothetical protein
LEALHAECLAPLELKQLRIEQRETFAEAVES